jgi:hypothetical protein
MENTEVVVSRGRFETDSAEIDQQIATAKRWPRDIGIVKRGIESMATLDQETAEACFYSLPRGGKTIQGPGVRMAEIAVHNFGNIRVQTRIAETVIDGPAPHVTVVSACHDLEKNVWVGIEKRRRIVAKKDRDGTRKKVDEDDINLATNACAAIAFRDAAFKVIPGALIKPAFEAAKRVAIGDAKTLVDRRTDAISRFAKMGVNQARVLQALEKTSVEAVGLVELETLFGMFTAIRDGQASIEEVFPIETKAPVHGVAGVKAALEQTNGLPPKGGESSKAAVAPSTDAEGKDQGQGGPGGIVPDQAPPAQTKRKYTRHTPPATPEQPAPTESMPSAEPVTEDPMSTEGQVQPVGAELKPDTPCRCDCGLEFAADKMVKTDLGLVCPGCGTLNWVADENAPEQAPVEPPPAPKEQMYQCSQGHFFKESEIVQTPLARAGAGQLGKCPRCVRPNLTLTKMKG